MTPRHATLAALLALSDCVSSAGTDPPVPTTTQTPETPRPTPPSAPAQAVRVTAPACGYGGSATAVAVFLDLETDVALSGVGASFEVVDPRTGTAIGRSAPDVTLLVSPEARGLLDFSTQGTTPFGGSLAAGSRTRLQIFAGLTGDTLPLASGIEVRVALRDGSGRTWDAVCTTGEMWPSS
jgi:hypothetical protein